MLVCLMINCSCFDGIKEEEMIWKIILVNWWNVVYDWVLKRGVGEC